MKISFVIRHSLFVIPDWLRARNQSGQVLIYALSVVAILVIAIAVILSIATGSGLSATRSVQVAQAIHVAEAGIDKAINELKTTPSYSGESNTILTDGTFSVSVSGSGNTRTITSTGHYPNAANPAVTRTIEVKVRLDTTNIQFFYGVQVDDGGMTLGNNAAVNGNVFSNGSLNGNNGATINGTAIVAGAATPTQINNIDITGDAHANTIRDLTVTANAYFQSLINSTVIGTQFPNSSDPERQELPVNEQNIDDWKAVAAAGGTHTGDYLLTNGSTGNLGPKKITGKLILDNLAKLTLTGTLWVQGDIELSNNCIIELDPSYGEGSGIIVTDGKVTVDNNCAFIGSGTDGSYTLLLSDKDAPTEEIMDINNNSVGVIYYAGRGRIKFSNNASAKEATAYGITMDNNAIIDYESGLSNVNFVSGPGGGWRIVPGSWHIINP